MSLIQETLRLPGMNIVTLPRVEIRTAKLNADAPLNQRIRSFGRGLSSKVLRVGKFRIFRFEDVIFL